MHNFSDIYRYGLVGGMVAVAAVNVVNPDYFLGMEPLLARVRCALSSDQASRLQEVLAVGYPTEPYVMRLTVAVGILGFAMAALMLTALVPPTLPFGLYCAALVIAMSVAYARRRVAGRPRMASIQPRPAFSSFSPWLILSATAALAGSISIAFLPGMLSVGTFVSIAVAAMLAVAGNVAVRPVTVLGVDPSLESAVEDRFRLCTVAHQVMIASTLAYIACSWSRFQLQDSDYVVASIAQLGTTAGLVVAAVTLGRISKNVGGVLAALTRAA